MGVIVIVLNWNEVTQVIRKANWHLSPLALLFSAISYFLTGYSFLLVNRIFGVTLRKRDLIEIGYVTNALDNLLPGAGFPGMSLRVLILKRRGLDTDGALSVSLFRSYFNNLIFISFLPMVLIYMLFNQPLSGIQSTGIWVAIVMIVLIVFSGVMGVFVASFRHRVLSAISRLWRFFTRHDIKPSLDRFDESFEYGIRAIEGNPRVLVLPVGVIVCAWLSTAIALWFCFIALGNYLGFGTVLTGFIIGRTAGVLSFLPGGMGTQDASMVGVYVIYGVPLAEAVLTDILFRAVYYFIPFALSLGFYRRLLR